MNPKRIIRLLKTKLRQLFNKEVTTPVQVKCSSKVELGSEYGGYCVCGKELKGEG